MRGRNFLWALLVAVCAAAPARADIADTLSFSGYADLRLVAPANDTAWLRGGLGKFRFGPETGGAQAAEAYGQLTVKLDDDLRTVIVARAEPRSQPGIDAMEAYLTYTPALDDDLHLSVKAGAFYPTISLENDDLGWASPYTLTPSAINSWIGEEMRTIGSEARLRWSTSLGNFTGMFALLCCNDEQGMLLADRGWAMDDRPTGLFGRVRLPDATLRAFHAPVPGTTGEFDEIDSRVGWYAGLEWQMANVGKLTVVRYDNNGDPSDKTGRGDTAWPTRFWNVGGRTQFGALMLIAQGMTGYTAVTARPGLQARTDFQSAFLLASYDLDDLGLTDFRASAREDVFQTRRVSTTPSPYSEDGDAFTASLSWQGSDHLRLTGEVIAMNSRRLEYVAAGLGGPVRHDTQFQFSTRIFF
jgi:hypothetical protein